MLSRRARLLGADSTVLFFHVLLDDHAQTTVSLPRPRMHETDMSPKKPDSAFLLCFAAYACPVWTDYRSLRLV